MDNQSNIPVSNSTYWPSMILNAVAFMANSGDNQSTFIIWAKWTITILAALLTVVSLINQSVVLYTNANKYHVVTIVKRYYFKIKKKKP